MSEINLEDLTPGTVVELKPLTVTDTPNAEGLVRVSIDGSWEWFARSAHVARIISRPEPDADKIARLERELAERDARIAELTAPARDSFPDRINRIQEQVIRLQDQIDTMVATLTSAPNPLIGEPTCYDEDAPTSPVWSDPIEGPPNPKLPVGSYEVGVGRLWAPCASTEAVQSAKRHRILMHQPIKWDGGERPVPGDWEVDLEWPEGGALCGVPVDAIDWRCTNPFTFTLTSTGGGNG